MAGEDLLATLRRATRADHGRLERLLDLPGRVAGPVDLAVVLAALLVTWPQLERHLAAAAGWARLGLPPTLGDAADLLQRDFVRFAGPSQRPVIAPVRTVHFGGLASAVGGRYVLLGSALGGRALASRIDAQLGLRPGDGPAFFRRDGRDAAGDWHAFRSAVASYPWSAGDVEYAVKSASQTFRGIAEGAQLVLSSAAGEWGPGVRP